MTNLLFFPPWTVDTNCFLYLIFTSFVKLVLFNSGSLCFPNGSILYWETPELLNRRGEKKLAKHDFSDQTTILVFRKPPKCLCMRQGCFYTWVVKVTPVSKETGCLNSTSGCLKGLPGFCVCPKRPLFVAFIALIKTLREHIAVYILYIFLYMPPLFIWKSIGKRVSSFQQVSDYPIRACLTCPVAHFAKYLSLRRLETPASGASVQHVYNKYLFTLFFPIPCFIHTGSLWTLILWS